MTTHFKVSSPYYYSTPLSKTIESNLIVFFDWGFIDYGAYTNVRINTSGAYGGNFSQLRPVNDPNYTNGRVWEAIRGNWVWESGLSFGTPIRISGVYINNTINTSGYTIDYNNGRIIFPSAISTGNNVKVEYSYKEVQVMSASDNPVFKQVQYKSRRPGDNQFTWGSGLYTAFSTNKVNLPCVSVEVFSRKNDPFQVGGGQYANYVAKFHIMGESDQEVSKISDVICDQDRKIIFAFDLDQMATANAFPLKFDGSLNSNPLSYPDLVKLSGVGGYRTEKFHQGKIRMYDCKSQTGKWIHQNLYMNTVDMYVEVIVPTI